jgi:hypothetical protein
MTFACALAALASLCTQVLPPATVPPIVRVDVPGTPARMAVGAGALWVAEPYGDPGRVLRVNRATNRVVAKIPLERAPSDIAAGADAIWVTGTDVRGGDVLYRIDASTDRVVATIALPGRFAGPLALGDESVWVVVTDRRRTLLTLVRVDPATSAVASAVPVARRWVADELAIRDGAAWLLTRAGEVLRFDLGARRVVERGDVPACPDVLVPVAKLTPLLAGRRHVWLGGRDGRDRTVAYRLDRSTGRVDRKLRLGSAIYTGMTADARSHTLWIARARGDLLRVDLARR